MQTTSHSNVAENMMTKPHEKRRRQRRFSLSWTIIELIVSRPDNDPERTETLSLPHLLVFASVYELWLQFYMSRSSNELWLRFTTKISGQFGEHSSIIAYYSKATTLIILSSFSWHNYQQHLQHYDSVSVAVTLP